MKKSFIMGLLLSLILVCFTSPAFAALANSSAYLDVSSLLGTPNIAWQPSTFYTSANATAQDLANGSLASNPAPLGTWGAVTASISTKDQGTGSVEAKGVGIATAASLASSAKADTSSSQDPSGTGTTNRSGVFQYMGQSAADVTFTIPYILAYDFTTAPNGSLAFGSARVLVTLSKMSGDPSNSYDKFVGDLAYDGEILKYSTAMDALVKLWLQPGEFAKLELKTEATAGAAAPVPIPAAFWLLGSGLVGLIGIRRRKK